MTALRALFYFTCIILDLVLSGLSFTLNLPLVGGFWARHTAVGWHRGDAVFRCSEIAQRLADPPREGRRSCRDRWQSPSSAT
jgi:hypothetical protein